MRYCISGSIPKMAFWMKFWAILFWGRNILLWRATTHWLALSRSCLQSFIFLSSIFQERAPAIIIIFNVLFPGQGFFFLQIIVIWTHVNTYGIDSWIIANGSLTAWFSRNGCTTTLTTIFGLNRKCGGDQESPRLAHQYTSFISPASASSAVVCPVCHAAIVRQCGGGDHAHLYCSRVRWRNCWNVEGEWAHWCETPRIWSRDRKPRAYFLRRGGRV